MTQTNWKASYGRVRKRFMAAIAMLLISAIMLVSSTYAWFVLSTAPEVKGMSTTVGANGSLEIALRSTNDDGTGDNPITSGTADSIVTTGDWLVTNGTWGNIIDISDASYGFSDLENGISLYPARLNLTSVEGGGYTVNNASPLIGPRYGADGRVAVIDKALTTGVYEDGGFVTGRVGVRGIGDYVASATGGTERTVTRAELASSAKTRMDRVTNSVLTNLGAAVNDILVTAATLTDAEFVDGSVGRQIVSFISTFKTQAENLREAVGYAYLMEKLDSGWTAESGKTPAAILDEYKAMELSAIASAADSTNAKAAAGELTTIISSAGTALTSAQGAEMTSGDNAGQYRVSTLKSAINQIFNYNNMYLYDLEDNLQHLSAAGSASLKGTWLTHSTVYYLYSDAGAIAHIAAITGKYSFSLAAVSNKPMNVSSKTYDAAVPYSSVVDPGYLAQVPVTTNTETATTYSSDAANGATYGFAVDLAFRTNAAGGLVLTTPVARVKDVTDAALMGAGSTITSEDSTVLAAVRVVFIDAASNALLGVAKAATTTANTANPLVLYPYTVSDGVIALGDTPSEDPAIASLLATDAQRNITAIVYLDGDAYNGEGGSGARVSLNLQFASTATLTPMEYNGYLPFDSYANGDSGTAVGGTAPLSLPDSVNAGAVVTWTSSNTAVATVAGGEGNAHSATVTGVAAGTAIITASWPAGGSGDDAWAAGSQTFRVLIVES